MCQSYKKMIQSYRKRCVNNAPVLLLLLADNAETDANIVSVALLLATRPGEETNDNTYDVKTNMTGAHYNY